MLRKIIFFTKLSSQYASGDFRCAIFKWNKTLDLGKEQYGSCNARSFQTCELLNKDRRKELAGDINMKENLVVAETAIGNRDANDSMYPDENLPNKIIQGVMFKEIPIVNIRVTSNNTIYNLTDFKGRVKLIRSCGIEGFKNAKKGTTLAAQATGMTFGQKALEIGYKTVRLRIKGLGPGRSSSVRGLMLSGLNIISITDNTHVSYNPHKGKKLRRI